MVRQEDIAKVLNLSRTTVARALNGNKNIKQETKEKVLKVAKELGYEKNPISSSLASKKQKKVYAFIIKSKNKYYTNEIKRGIKKAQNEFGFYGYKINIIETDIETPENQIKELKRVIKEEDVHGIIITPLLKEEVKNIKIKNPDIFFVTLGIGIDKTIFHVGSDYFKSGRISSEILINMVDGNSKILVLDTVDDRISSKLYMDGFLSRMKEEKNNLMVGPIYSKELMKDLDHILEKYMIEEVKAIYATRFLANIVEYVEHKYNKHMKVVGNGMSYEIRDLIMQRKIVSTVFEQNYEESYLAAKCMFEKLYRGRNFKKNYYILESKIAVRESLCCEY